MKKEFNDKIEKELKGKEESVVTELFYRIFKVTTVKECNKLLDKVEESIEKYKCRMDEQEYEKFKYFVFGYQMIDMHIMRPDAMLLTNLAYDANIKEKEQEKKKEGEKEEKEEISLDNIFGDIKQQLNDLLNAFKRL